MLYRPAGAIRQAGRGHFLPRHPREGLPDPAARCHRACGGHDFAKSTGYQLLRRRFWRHRDLPKFCGLDVPAQQTPRSL